MTRFAGVAGSLESVRGRIEAVGRDPAGVRIVAATKEQPADAVVAALSAGIHDIGESYAQELLGKVDELGDRVPGARWHFVGRLQRNKVRSLAPVVSLWHSVDRAPLVREIARRSPGAAVLVQVNVTGEAQKGGCPPGEAPGLVEVARAAGLDVRGLMTIGPDGPAERARAGFRSLRRVADDLGLADCSMGMSRDLEVAVEEGATIVRIGQALFGPRPGTVARG